MATFRLFDVTGATVGQEVQVQTGAGKWVKVRITKIGDGVVVIKYPLQMGISRFGTVSDMRKLRTIVKR